MAGRPVMSYIVERMLRAGCSRVKVVTRPEKRDVAAVARELGAEVVHARPANVSASILAGLDGLVDDDVVLLGFPDTVWQPLDGYTRLLSALTPSVTAVLGLFKTVDLRRSDVVTLDAAGVARGVEVKPEDPRSDWIWGAAVAPARALRGLAGVEEPGRYFDELCRAGTVLGVQLSDRWVDIGEKATVRERRWKRVLGPVAGERSP